MSDSTCSLFEQPPCTACDPRLPATPLPRANPPGQPALRYRVGDFVTFRQAMLERLTAGPVKSVDPANPDQTVILTSRASDDYAIALLELWAYVGDVLTFYQQAIANEAFLRTAVLRESLARLAALIGYEPFRGVAAKTWLAFLADKGSSTQLPAGFQTQSVPPPGANPATFETVEALAVSAANNQPILLGPPQDATFGTGGELVADPGLPAIVAGTRLLFYTTTSPVHLSEHVVTSVTPTGLGKLVQWRGDPGNLKVKDVSVARLGRKFRYFGANAPEKYLAPDGATTFQFITMSSDGTVLNDAAKSFSLTESDTLYLDGVYDGLAVGGRVLVAINSASPSAREAHIVEVTEAKSLRGPISGPCTRIRLSLNPVLPSLNDLRVLAAYELIGDNVTFRTQTNNSLIEPNTAILQIADPGGITKGTRLLLVEKDQSDNVFVTQTPDLTQKPPVPVSINPPLAHTYHASKVKVWANVVQATHGETQNPQVLGDGDASQEWQEFAVPLAPVTYVPDRAADRGARSTLQILVDGIAWTEVPSFYGRGAAESVFVTRIDENGRMVVRFGDGKTGRRLPTGQGNIKARFRKGLGIDGNVPAGSVSVLLQTLPGIKSVTNVLGASGGEEAEPVTDLRRNAPTTVITLERAVSLRDHAALALSYPNVAKARAAWADFGSRRGVSLTVAPAASKPMAELEPDLHQYLDEHRDPNVPLSIQGPTSVYFQFNAVIHVAARYLQSVVKAACEQALGPVAPGGYLSFDRLDFGQTIFPSALVAVLQNVAGVDWVELTEFSIWPSAAGHDFGSDPKRLDAVIVDAGEIAAAVLDTDHTPGVTLQYQGGINDL